MEWAINSPLFIMKKYSNNKDIRKLITNLLCNQWLYTSGRKHGKLHSPEGKRITVPTSPSDRRAYKNFLNDIQKLMR